MSSFESAAAGVGIIKFALQSIIRLNHFIKQPNHIPDKLRSVRCEIDLLLHVLYGIGWLKDASKNTQNDVKDVGLPGAVNVCGLACAELWTKFGITQLDGTIGLTGGGSIWYKVETKLKEATVRRYLAIIAAARATTILAVNTVALLEDHSTRNCEVANASFR